MPHGDLMIVYDRNGHTVFKETDLAIVVLRGMVRGIPEAVKLARSEVRIGDFVVMAGYEFGDEEEDTGASGDRFFGESQVLRVARSESGDVLFFTGGRSSDGGPAAGVYSGDSGGPCFSKADRTMLVGITSAHTLDDDGNRLSVFTSIYPHREWVKEVARTAGSAVR